MIDPILMICSLTGCSEEEAKAAFEETEDVIDAVDRLLEKPVLKSEKFIPKVEKKALSEEQIEIQKVRELMEQMDAKHTISLGQPDCVESSVQQDLPEEMVLQNNCSQQCQLPSLEEEVQIQETAYPLLSEYFCGSQ
jgi:hypothetical protein